MCFKLQGWAWDVQCRCGDALVLSDPGAWVGEGLSSQGMKSGLIFGVGTGRPVICSWKEFGLSLNPVAPSVMT